MSDNDKLLIAEAKRCHSSEWYYIRKHLQPQAESDEARAELRMIENKLYHLEEYGVRAL